MNRDFFSLDKQITSHDEEWTRLSVRVFAKKKQTKKLYPRERLIVAMAIDLAGPTALRERYEDERSGLFMIPGSAFLDAPADSPGAEGGYTRTSH